MKSDDADAEEDAIVAGEAAGIEEEVVRPVAMRLDDVHCHYQVFAQREDSMAARIARGMKNRESRSIHALRGVTLTVREGEALGVVGSNGAGKSTLLRAMSGSLIPTSGEVLVSSQPQKISVAWALNRELTGRRNIELGLLGLGFRPADVSELEESVIEFADIGRFIGMPMKTYSTGMRARLGFAIAAAASPAILLMDEALAVGDRAFRYKCMQRISQLTSEARTVVMASHDVASVKTYCDRALWLEGGTVRALGPAEEVVDEYYAASLEAS